MPPGGEVQDTAAGHASDGSDPSGRAAPAAARASGAAEAISGSVHTSTSPSRAIVSRLDCSIAVGCSGHGVSTTAAIVSVGRSGRLEREQRVVDRPEAGPGGDQQRQPQRDGERADVEILGDRDEQAADALDDEHLAVRGERLRSFDDRRGSTGRARQLGGEMGRHGRTVGADDDLIRPAPGGPRQQHVVRRPVGVGRIFEAGDHRLERADVDAGAAQPGDDRAREDGSCRRPCRCR